MEKTDKIYIAGHKGMVGSALARILRERGFDNLVLKSHDEVDLRNEQTVSDFLTREKPQVVILAAARVGGIQANMKHPAEFLYDNLKIQNNVIHHSWRVGVAKFCFLGSSCIYPRECPQPMKEEYLLTGPLEPTNEGYALAKIAGLKMVEYYHKQYDFPGISLMPCNLYGTNDSYDLEHSHVLSAMVRRFVDAVDNKTQKVTLWGTGKARREFMHVDDAAEVILHTMDNCRSGELINIGWGDDITIYDLAHTIAKKAGFEGELAWDNTRPDGMLLKCMDISKMQSIGFQPKISLEQGIAKTIQEYKELKAKGLL